MKTFTFTIDGRIHSYQSNWRYALDFDWWGKIMLWLFPPWSVEPLPMICDSVTIEEEI